MATLNPPIVCEYCSTPTSVTDETCQHCLRLFCRECLIKHHHNDVPSELKDMIEKINLCLAPFLHHAHNQTEWTDHLTEDQNRLQNYLHYIKTSYPQMPVYSLPKYTWIVHVNDLIKKRSIAIYEDCYKILYPSSFKTCT